MWSWWADFIERGMNGGEGGIRTHGTDIHRYNRLAGDPVQPLQHLSAGRDRFYCIIFYSEMLTKISEGKHVFYRDIGKSLGMLSEISIRYVRANESVLWSIYLLSQ